MGSGRAPHLHIMKITNNMRKGVMGRDPQGFCSTRFMVMHRAKDTKELVELLWKYRKVFVESTNVWNYGKDGLSFGADVYDNDYLGMDFLQFVEELKGLSRKELFAARNMRKDRYVAKFQKIVDERMAEFDKQGTRKLNPTALYRQYLKTNISDSPEVKAFPLAEWLLKAA